MFEVDRYLDAKFHITRYNCWHFVRDVWLDLTGEVLYDYTPADTNRHELGLAAHDAEPRFDRVTESLQHHILKPLIVLFRHATDPTPHVGVWYKGKVLHLRAHGAHYQPLDVAAIGFNQMDFYIPRKAA